MTTRITNAATAFAYLAEIGADVERDPKAPDARVLIRWACGRCGGSGQYHTYGVCYSCGGVRPREVRSISVVTHARRAKANRAAAKRREDKRTAQRAEHATRREAVEAAAADALDALRSHFADGSGYVAAWAPFLTAAHAWAEARDLDRRMLVDAVRDARTAEIEAAREAAREARAAASAYVGTVGERREFSLTLARVFSFEAEAFNQPFRGRTVYETRHGYVFTDADGATLVWITGSAQDFEVGARYAGKARIKAHRENTRDGVRETHLARANLKPAD